MMKRVTTRRIFPLRKESYAAQYGESDGSNVEMQRLIELVKGQQDLIVQFALRDFWSEKGLRDIAVDSLTSEWLEENFGDACVRFTEHVLITNTLFNTSERLPSLRSLFSWSDDIVKIREKAGKQAEADIIAKFEFPIHIENLDEGALRKSIEELGNNDTCLWSLHAMACFLTNLRSFDAVKPYLYLREIQALAMLLATIIIQKKKSDAFDDVRRYLNANKSTWLSKLTPQAQHGLQEVLFWCAAATDPACHWSVARNLDLIKALEIDDQNSLYQGSNTDVQPSKSHGNHRDSLTEDGVTAKPFSDTVIQQRVLTQGAFRATQQSLVCRPEDYAERLVRQTALSSKTYKGVGESEPELVQGLLGLNLVDFVAAPLWVPLTLHCPTLQEPLANLFLNRALWSERLQVQVEQKASSSEVFAQLRNLLSKRSRAFDESFGHTRFDAQISSNSEMPIIHRDSSTAAAFRNNDYLTAQVQELSATGAIDTFLSMIRSGEPREQYIQQALASTIGFIEVSKCGRRAKYARMGTAQSVIDQKSPMSPGNSGKSILSGKLKGNKKLDNHVKVLPKSFLKKSPKELKENESQNAIPVSHIRIRQFMDNNLTQSLVAFLTIFALFGDDFKLAVFSSSADALFGYITLGTLIIFCAEIAAKTVVDPEFKYGFFFWLDVLATVSLIPDIPLIWDLVVAGVDSFGSDADSLTVTRAGRASRAGARAARMLRILRLVRLLRIFKLYEYVARQREKVRMRGIKKPGKLESGRYVSKYLIRKRIVTQRHSNLSRPVPVGEQQQSKVGAKLADLTTRRVIVVVLVILFMLPLINMDETDYSFEASVGIIHIARINLHKGLITASAFNATLQDFIQGSPKLLYLKTTPCDTILEPQCELNAFNGSYTDLYGEVSAGEALRTAELQIGVSYCSVYSDNATSPAERTARVYCSISESLHDQIVDEHYGDLYANDDPTQSAPYTEGYFDNRDFEIESAWRSIVQTIFIIFIFGVATMIFTYDAHKLVIAPIEKMVRIVEELAENPLTTFENDEEEDDPTGLLAASREAYEKKNGKPKTDAASAYETQLLENAIKKIGGLLQVGFGEAGAEIIASNMNTEGELDPMIPGRKVQAIFGFCDIRNFMSTTEILGEEIMLYVNEIANIVHSQVSSYSGNANRNMGDSFLVVWKRNPSESETWTQIAEKALISFLKITIEVYRNQDLRSYTTESKTVGTRFRAEIPDFKVKLGFGLHIGWAIEGAIGSNQKIDASYLSPHVNLTNRLENITRQYGLSILFSGDFFDLLGNDAKVCSRKVDEVLIKGMHTPVALYTYDCNLDSLQKRLDSIRLRGDGSQQDEETVVDRRISLIGPSPIIDHARNIATIQKSAFRTDLELRALQWEYPRHFLPICRKGVGVYLAGHWGDAKSLLEAACKMFPAEENGPSGYILRFMEQYNFKAPLDWPGYRIMDKVTLSARKNTQ